MHTSLLLLHHAVVVASSTGTTKKKSSSNYTLLILVAIFAAVYLLFLRPARNRQRAAMAKNQAKNRDVQVGDEVTTTAGLIANVVAVNDDFITLEVAPGVHSRYVPAAILRVNGLEDEADDDQADTVEPDATNHEVIEQPTTDEPPKDDHPDGSAPA